MTKNTFHINLRLTRITEPEVVLRNFWSYDSFRPLQKEIIHSILEGHDTFALLPTGGGKSICYQVPALSTEGICLVISPLISLMSDQVSDLKKRGIKAMLINSFMTYREIDQALDSAIYGNYKLLYVSPERLQSDLFLDRFKKMNVSFIAVDEGHCISQWGYDFRPAYLDIFQLREIHQVPILALTATATGPVAQDIVSQLRLQDVRSFKKSFARDNIFFEVRQADNKLQHLKQALKDLDGSGIIYVRNRRKCQEVADVLNHQGFSAQYYHAGLDHVARERIQTDWMNNKSKIIVATNAFGMGIDKSDVRYVFHLDLPDSLEAFYQEAGRAGRDGKESRSMVLYNEGDVKRLQDQFEINFPSIEEIKTLYQQLGLFFQLAEGSGEMQSMAFDIEAFSSRFKKSKVHVFNCMKQLEKEGLISLSVGFYQPSRLHVHQGKSDLLHFREENAGYSPLIAYLLRAYSGVMEQEVSISEKEISTNTGIDSKEVSEKLHYLEKLDLLTYKPASDTPNLTFLTPRKSGNDVVISSKDYLTRKSAHKARIDAMKAYVNSDDVCRSRIILDYFNESGVKEHCGHCDVCQKQGAAAVSPDVLKKELLSLIGKHEISLDELSQRLENYPKELIRSSCRELCKLELIELRGKDHYARP